MKLPTALFTITTLPSTLVSSQSSQVDRVHDDVSTINRNVLELTGTTKHYNGGLVNQLPFIVDFGPVYLATRRGFYDSVLLPDPLAQSDAQRLIEHVNATLAVNNPIAVGVVKSKKVFFDDAGTSQVVRGGLELLLFAHLSFSNEVAKRIVDEEQRAEGQAVIDVITVALEDGIAFFSS
ncbi:hypothetical protein CERZMDRAFT_99921 [Cercospora zeae-maydis SCOH1-5]|uniref:Uncharacterized protein n=1 Tax=Cercospora zeae-maydis SCOH1-5 TaxID=717836 RepID=A0A6A6F8Y4_9PEZI|nr:hypothetical protein CERZMDRAFT_99921 [Cercospora zeae-maydis SCOH1-5]